MIPNPHHDMYTRIASSIIKRMQQRLHYQTPGLMSENNL